MNKNNLMCLLELETPINKVLCTLKDHDKEYIDLYRLSMKVWPEAIEEYREYLIENWVANAKKQRLFEKMCRECRAVKKFEDKSVYQQGYNDAVEEYNAKMESIIDRMEIFFRHDANSI